MAAGVAKVRQDEPFKNLVANFGSTRIELCPWQAIANAATHHEKLVELHISHGEMLDIIPDDLMDRKFRKRHLYPKNIDTIKTIYSEYSTANLARSRPRN